MKVGKYSHYQTTPVQREREERGKEGTEESLDGAVVFFVFFYDDSIKINNWHCTSTTCPR